MASSLVVRCKFDMLNNQGSSPVARIFLWKKKTAWVKWAIQTKSDTASLGG